MAAAATVEAMKMDENWAQHNRQAITEE